MNVTVAVGQALPERLRLHLSTPLYRDGYALILSSGLTSVAGIAYWTVAAREYSPRVVGINSAAISVMTFLAGIAHLNLMSALIRFIPAAGHTIARFVIVSYALSVVLAGLVSSVFVFGLNHAFRGLPFQHWGTAFAVWFVIATMSWCVFVLQDAVLTGLRRAVFVPVENAVFTIGKIALLALFASLLPRTGIFVSWTVAALATAIPTSAFILLRLVPRYVRSSTAHVEPVTVRRVRRFVAVDYVGSLFWLAATTLPPILVTVEAGATANAYFSLAWFMSYPLLLISINMGAALVASAATHESSADSYTWQALVQTARLVVPAVALVVAGASLLLHMFGTAYSHHATLTLRLLALAAIPGMVNVLYVSRARLRRQMSTVAAVLGAECAIALGLSLLLVTRYGGSGVAAAWLVSQTAIAVAIATLEPRRVQLLLPSRRISGRQERHPSGDLVREALRRHAPTAPWLAHEPIPTVSDVTVARVGPEGAPAAVVKVARSDRGAHSLGRHAAALEALTKDERLGSWRSLLPPIVGHGSVSGRPYLVEGLLDGVEAGTFAARFPALREGVEEAAAAAIGELHRRTGRAATVDRPLLDRLVGRPLLVLRDLEAAPDGRHRLDPDALRRLASQLTGALAGRQVGLAWIHGDFALANILVAPESVRVLGIVDWEFARPDDLPILDILQLLLSGRMIERRSELGDVVRELLAGAPWSEREQALLTAARTRNGGAELEVQPMLLLCWLRHVASNLTKSARYGRHWLWVRRNVTAVLAEATAA